MLLRNCLQTITNKLALGARELLDGRLLPRPGVREGFPLQALSSLTWIIAVASEWSLLLSLSPYSPLVRQPSDPFKI